MRCVKLLMFFLLLTVLSACAEKLTSGAYHVKVGTKDMMFDLGTAEIRLDRIILGGRYQPVDHWERDGNIVTAFDRDGSNVFQVCEEDGGKTLVVMNLEAGMRMTLTLLDEASYFHKRA